MLMNHHLFENLEIAFWNTTIPALIGMRWLRQAFYHGQAALFAIIPARVWLQSVVWSLIGLIFGVLLGTLSASL